MPSHRLSTLLAGIADFYIVSILLAGSLVLGIQLQLIPPSFPLRVAVLLLAGLISLGYYRWYAAHTPWLSVGELLMGRRVTPTTKIWHNPYGINRSGLLLILFSLLIMVSNTWDAVFDGYFMSITFILIRWILLGMVVLGSIDVGQGRLTGMHYLSGYLLIHALLTSYFSRIADAFIYYRWGIVTSIGLAVLVEMVALFYQARRSYPKG